MINCKTIKLFDIACKTELIFDASPIGLGAVLSQRDEDGDLRIMKYASRALTQPEKNYSQTENEAFGVVWGCEHFNMYLYGALFKVITDHKPLVAMMNNPLIKTTARLECLC